MGSYPGGQRQCVAATALTPRSTFARIVSRYDSDRAVRTLPCRIGEREVLVSEIDAWQKQRNASGARIKWKFTTQKARHKLARAYPDTAKES